VNTNSGVYIGNGGSLTPTGFTSGWWPTINDANEVGFLSSPSNVVVTPFGVVGTAGNVDVAVNNAPAVAFTNGSVLYLQPLGAPAPPLVLADTTGPLANISPGPALNDLGVAAFDATLDAGGTGVFRADGVNPMTTIALADGATLLEFEQSPSINRSGTVAFSAVTPTGRAILTGNGGGLLTITTSCSACQFNDLGRSPDINDSGTVVFDALINASCGPGSCTGVFTGDAGGVNKLIQEGDSLFGSTLRSVTILDRPRINNAGQIAFGYQLSDGRFGVALATPDTAAPEPASWTLMMLGAVWFGLTRRGYSSRSAVIGSIREALRAGK
jgi:hypothetical protein